MRLAPLLGAAAAAWGLFPSFVPADDAALTAQAIRMCQQNFDGKEQPGPMLEGPALVVLAGEKLDDWRFKAALPASAASAQPKTVFCVRSRHEKTGTYSDGSGAFSEHWSVIALSWPDGVVRRKGTLAGRPPPLVKKTPRGEYPRDEYGSVSESGLEAWLKGSSSDVLLASFTGAAFLSPDGRTLAMAVEVEKDKATQLLDWPSQAMRQRVGKDWPVGFLPDGRLMIAQRRETGLWDLGSGRQVGTMPFSGGSAAFSRDGTRAIGTGKSEAFWEVPSGRLLSDATAINLWTSASALSRDGRHACVVVKDKVTLWDTTQGRATATFEIKDVDAINIGTTTARCAVSGDARLAVFDVREGLYKLTAADGSVQRLGDSFRSGCLALSSGGRWLAVGGSDQLLLWDLAAGKEVVRSPSRGQLICQIAFSADDSLLWQRGPYVNAESRTQLWDARRLIDQAAAAVR